MQKERIKRLQKILYEKKIDYCMLFNLNSTGFDKNLFYFSGFSGAGVLIVPKKGMPTLVVPAMEKLKAKKTGIRVLCPKKKSRLFEIVFSKIIKKGKIAIDKKVCTLFVYSRIKKYARKCRFCDASSLCEDIRSVKSDEEIRIIKKSCNIADEILSECIKRFKVFKTEKNVCEFLERETKKRGCELSFLPIVASGKNAREPHHISEDKPIQKGFCIIDFGVSYKGYCSDITRTVYVGKPKKKEIDEYNFLLSVQKDAIKTVGKKNCGKLYDYAVKLLGKKSRYFTHGLGHGIGVEIHEKPNISINSKDKFLSGMIFTIEPGIYTNKYGIRIEDDVLYINGKIEVITKTKKELIVIK